MGAGESVIRNLDKRSARREHRDVFVDAVAAFRAARAAGEDRQHVEPGTAQGADQLVRVFVRKRPIFAHELEEKEFDVVTCDAREQVLTIHDARMQADMKNRFIDHHAFRFNQVFSENDDSDRVFDQVASPIVGVVREGGNGTVLMYGQTGSGKTFTMSHIYKRASWELFKETLGAPGVGQCFVSFVELAGDTCHDMLNENAKLQILSCPNGDVITYPAVQVPVSSPQELHDCIKFACGLRATAATGVHDHSSRSHAICRIETAKGNALTLVDLAGSEHRIDSAEHDAQRRKESAQINSSLMKLKECIRARAKQAKYVPYRQSKLTLILRPSFVDEPGKVSKTVIIATVSPSSKDTEHSLNTVRHACIMDGQDQEGRETRWVSGGDTVREELAPVDVTMLARKRKKERDALRAKGAEKGGGTGSWSAPRSATANRDGSFDRVAQAASLKKQAQARERQRRQAESSSLKAMDAATREKLMDARASCGELQRARMHELKRQEAAEQFEVDKRRREEQQMRTRKTAPPKKQPNNRQVVPSNQSQVQEPASTLVAQKTQERVIVRANPAVSRSVAPGQQQPQSAAIKPDLDAIRQEVWNDPWIPDDEKEEQIVVRIRAAKQQQHEPVQQDHRVQKKAALVPETTPSPRLDVDGPPTADRHEQARRARQRLMEEEQRVREEKLRSKMAVPRGAKTDDKTALEAQIRQLETQISSEQDKMARYGLQQQLKRCKAGIMRIERQRAKVQEKQTMAQDEEARRVAFLEQE